jgi:hypothetical protein
MRNPWVHDDVPSAAGSGYGGRVRVLGAFGWGTLLLGVGGTALLVGTGTVPAPNTGAPGSAVTFAVAGAALVLLSPLVLRLFAVSRLIGGIGLLASGWLLGGFVWSRESERVERLLAGTDGLGASPEAVDALSELLDALFAFL